MNLLKRNLLKIKSNIRTLSELFMENILKITYTYTTSFAMEGIYVDL